MNDIPEKDNNPKMKNFKNNILAVIHVEEMVKVCEPTHSSVFHL